MNQLLMINGDVQNHGNVQYNDFPRFDILSDGMFEIRGLY